MDEKLNNYKDLINLMSAAPQTAAPDHFTRRVMADITAKQKISLWPMLRQTFTEAGAMSWNKLSHKDTPEQNAIFYFLIAGFFFFFMGSVLLSSTFFIDYANRLTNLMILQSLILLAAAVSLMIGGMIIATDTPDNVNWAKRTIVFYEIMIVLSALLVVMMVKTGSGELWALITISSGILTGMILIKALENNAEENDATFTGDLHNA